jgi:hypothetical protein
MFTRIALASSLVALSLAFDAGSATAQVKGGGGSGSTQPGGSGGKGPQPTPPADLKLLNVQINEAAKTVVVTVRLEARIGVRGVPVRLTVSGSGGTLFDQTKAIDLPLNTTKTMTFTNVDIPAFRAQVAQNPLQAVRFLSISAKVDPDNAIQEGNEANNLFFRILTVN